MRPGLPAALAAALFSAAPAAAQAPGPLRIGLIAPLTGADAAFGQGMRQAAEQAVAEINRAGGAGGRRLVLVVGDDGGEMRQGAAAARRLAADGVRLVVGPLASSVAAAVAPILSGAGAVVLLPAAAYPPLTERGGGDLFRLGPSDAQQGAAAGAWLARRHPGGGIAVIHDRSTFGRGLADAAARALKAGGAREALFESLPRGSRDAAELAGRIRAADVQAVYFGGLAPEAAVLVKALREAGVTAAFAASDGILDRDFAALGPPGEGTVMTLPSERRPPEPRKGPVRSPEAEAVAGPVQAAVEILAQAVAQARDADGRKVAEVLRGGRFRTVLGEIAFDRNGDPTPAPVALRVWRRTPDGRLDYAGNEAPP